MPVVSVEASGTYGWDRYAHLNIGMTTFGASAPLEVCCFSCMPLNEYVICVFPPGRNESLRFYLGQDQGSRHLLVGGCKEGGRRAQTPSCPRVAHSIRTLSVYTSLMLQ